MAALPEQAIDPRVFDHAIREDVPVQPCGCETRNDGQTWFLCRYHDGMNDGLAIAAAPVSEQTERPEEQT